MCGLILALLSLGNLLQDIHPYLRYSFGLIAVVLIILILLKVIAYTDEIKKDFENPVILSSCGTFSMALMLLSTYVLEFVPSFAYGIWIIGICLHILLMIYFTYRFIIRNFNILNVYPSYWIVYIGITMGAITAHSHGLDEIGRICFIIGFTLMCITVPPVLYRYIRYPEIPDMNKPLTCIYTAIFSILIVGYVNSAEIISAEFLMILFILACICYIFAFSKLIEYIHLDFYPSFSAFTFPFVISALASKGASQIFSNTVMTGITWIERVIATVIVVYVLIKYVKFLKIVN